MKILKFILAAGLLGLLAACGGGGGNKPGLAKITVTPTTATVAVGATQQFQAGAFDASGQPFLGATFTWHSSDTSVATINSSGVATGVKAGTTNITATANGVTSNVAKLTVKNNSNQGKVATITVSPKSASAAVGATQQFTAVAKDAGGNTLSGITFTWASSKTSVASINSRGVATGKAVGTTIITASANSVTSNAATLTVNSSGGGGSVASITVSPDNPSIPQGTTQQFTAVAKDSGGNTLSGITFTWASSDTGVATVDSTGLANGVAAGITTITATAQGKSGSATLTVIGSGNGDFSIDAAPIGQSVAQGNSSNVYVDISDGNNTGNSVQLSLIGGAPSGLTATFNPNPATAGTGSVMTLSAGASTPPGTYSLYIQGKTSSDIETQALTVTVTTKHATLLVDHDSSDNNSGYSTNLSASDQLFRDLLDGASVGYDVYVVQTCSEGPTYDQLKNYDTVIWYTGDDYNGPSNACTISSTDELNLEAFLDQGNKRFIAFSSEYLDGVSGTDWTSSSNTFFTDYVGATGGVADVNNHVAYHASGVSGTVTEGDNLSVAKDSVVQSYNSPINPASGTDTLLTYVANPDGTTDRAVAIVTGNKNAGSGTTKSEVIFAAFPFENIVDIASNTRAALFGQLLSY